MEQHLYKADAGYDDHPGQGHSSDIDPTTVGWAVVIVLLLVWAWKTLGSNKANAQDRLGALGILMVGGVILAFVVAGNLFGWWGVIGLAGAIWYWFSNQKSPPKP